jgi:ABC-type uncharacterized transport system permease subunit
MASNPGIPFSSGVGNSVGVTVGAGVSFGVGECVGVKVDEGIAGVGVNCVGVGVTVWIGSGVVETLIVVSGLGVDVGIIASPSVITKISRLPQSNRSNNIFDPSGLHF